MAESSPSQTAGREGRGLAPEAYEEIRNRENCKVFKDRKFVVPRSMVSAIRSMLGRSTT